ncbi:MAG: E2/UBC family protein [Myxococcota bacterium]
MDYVNAQLGSLREAHSGAEARALPSGAFLVSVPNVRLPDGWNRQATTVWFIAPPGYPFARPDCFWVEPGLRLSNGAMPQNANDTPIPEDGRAATWFSWHVQQWNANRDTLLTYLRVIESRLRPAR